MEKIIIKKNNRDLFGEIKLPSSKSESNRALIIQALCKEGITIHNLSIAEDTQLLNRCLRYIETCGVSGIPMVVDAKNAGTVFRFLTTFLAIRKGKCLLIGSERMQQRPINQLVDSLSQLGVKISYPGKKGYPPLLISGRKLNGGIVNLDASVSSQFITALLLISPLMSDGIEINLKGTIVSRPYVAMTIDIMKHFGIKVDHTERQIKVSQQPFINNDFDVDPDWSAASYWYEMVALSDQAEIIIPGLKKESLQGDSIVHEIFNLLGVNTEFTSSGAILRKTKLETTFLEYDFIDCPDLAQAVIATCVGLGIEGSFSGLQSLRIKETDRVAKLNDELGVFGYSFSETEKNNWSLNKTGSVISDLNKLTFKTYDDHRMAMALAPLALKTNRLIIEDPNVVIKSYPGFWEDLKTVGFKINSL